MEAVLVHAWILALLILAAPSAPTSADEPPTPRPLVRAGETVRATLPEGDPSTTTTKFDVETSESGRLVIDARSLDFDTRLEVFRVGPDSSLAPAGQDDNGGTGSDSRLEVAVAPGDRLRVEVRAGGTGGSGAFELSVGFATAAPAGGPDAELDYWRHVERRAVERGDRRREALALTGQGVIQQNRGSRDEARSLLERALAIREQTNGPVDPDTAEVLANLAGVLHETGDSAAARPLLERVLGIKEQTLGPEHPETVLALNNLGVLLRVSGDWNAARPLLERALAIREKTLGSEDPDTAASLHALAQVLVDLGQSVAARPLFERALAIREKALGPEDPETASSIDDLGHLLLEAGDLAAARPLFERALAIREKALGPDHPHTAISCSMLGTLLQNLGEYTAARLLFERALAIVERAQGPDHPNTTAALNNLAGLLYAMGDYALARPLFERALTAAERVHGPEHALTASSLNNLATLLCSIGEFAAARPLYERALAVREKALGPDHPGVAVALNNLGSLLERLGEYDAARRAYVRALAIHERVAGPDHPNTAITLSNLAGLLKATGDYQAARPPFERALAIQERALGPEHPNTAVALNALASLLWVTGDYAAARPLNERALAIDEKAQGPEHPNTARSLINLATVLYATGEPAPARELMERGLAILERALGTEHPEAARVALDLAQLQAVQGETAGALARALQAERVGSAHQRLTSRSLSEREALRHAAVRRSGLDLVLTLVARGMDPDSRRSALDAVVRSRALVLDEMAARRMAASAAADSSITLELAERLASRRTRLANLAVRGPGGQKTEVYRRLLDEARGEKEAAERALAAASASFARELSRGRLGFEEIAAGLPESTALVSFSRFDRANLLPRLATEQERRAAPSYLAFVLRAGARAPEMLDLGTAEALDARVARWHEEASRGALLEEDADRAEARCSEAGSALRRVLWDPLSAAIGSASRVFVVPDGAIHLVNFAALPAEDGRYIVEEGPLVHYLSAERDLVPGGDSRRGEGLLALGGPSYDAGSPAAALRIGAGAEGVAPAAATYRGPRSACPEFSTLRFDPLPETTQEARQIARLWRQWDEVGDVADLSGAAASEGELKRLAPGRRVVHLATHGFFLGGHCAPAPFPSTRGIGGLTVAPKRPADAVPAPSVENPLLLSGLALAGANLRSEAVEGEDDGILTAEEIASLDLSGVEWAVLSACETGAGDVRAGEGVLGLRRAFQVAGARTLVLSLWSVEDDSTRAWMEALYKGRLERRLDTAESARRASLEAIQRRRESGESTHPFYWAAFVAAGDWR